MKIIEFRRTIEASWSTADSPPTSYFLPLKSGIAHTGRNVVRERSAKFKKACIICRNARHREITTCHGGDRRPRRSRRHTPPTTVCPGTESVRQFAGCVKYVGCPLERTTPGGAKRARGKEFNSGRYYAATGGSGGGGAVVSTVVVMTSGAPTAPVQYRRLTDVCPSSSPQHPVSPSSLLPSLLRAL